MSTHTIGYRDKVVIPDKYNTGPRVSTFTDKTSMVYIGKPNPRTYVGCHFKGQLAVKFGTGYIEDALYFKDCLFTNGGTYCLSVSNPSLILSTNAIYFENCEFDGFGSCCVSPAVSKMYFKNCKMHNSGGDGGKGFYHGGYENCYFYDIGRSSGAHADGIQTTAALNGFYMKNCRMDIPFTSENTANAGLFFIQEHDATDVVVKDLMMNGGNYTFYIGPKGGIEPTPVFTNITGENIKIGAAYQYGKFNHSEQFDSWALNGTVTDQDKLFVSSVYKGTNGKIKVHVTNYTMSQRTLVMVSDEETITQTIPAHYSVSEGHNHTFDEFPYDLEYEIDGNYVTCYDTSISAENQIRFQYCSVDELFGDIADAVRAKRGIVNDIYRVDLATEISQISGTATFGTKSITANGTYNASADNYDGYSQVTVAVPGSATLGTKSITQNGTYDASDDSLDGYSQVSVAVPQPSGKLTITQNGTDVDIAQYATADIAVPQGVVPTGSQTFTSNGTYDVTDIAQAVVNVATTVPATWSISDYTMEEDSETLVIPYDSTKTVKYLLCYNTNMSENTRYSAVSNEHSRVGSGYTTAITFTNNGGSMASSYQYGGISIDSENAQITLTNRGSVGLFRTGMTYKVLIVYTT